jgi:hypothetical protein
MILLALSAGMVLGAAAAATEAKVTNAAINHFSGSIVASNVFDLNPRTTAPQQTNPAVRRFFLAGIVTITGKKALIDTELQAKPGEPVKEEHFILAEGERKGDLEVVTIDEKAGTVKVTWAGIPGSLNFSDNAMKAASAPAPSPATLTIPEAIPNLSGSNPPPKQSAHPPEAPERPFSSFSMERARDRQELLTQIWADSQQMGSFFPRPIPMRIWPGPFFSPVYSSAFGGDGRGGAGGKDH